ncbi:MAG TPA: MinD/ParA family protein [Candidatus Limnocylindrales bacterium]|nr:MinD/ParA family protein [Candidatus Limnocylindrales bacterium]
MPPKIISVHSFRGGTGKSNTTANLAAIYGSQGMRVGVIDTDIQSPGIHVLFGVNEDDIKYSLNDYLWGKCEIQQTAVDVTASLNNNPDNRLHIPPNGTIYLIPSSIKVGEIARVLREGYDVGLLNDGFQNLVTKLNLDILLIDTHPGLNEETLLSIAISDALAILMRPDQQDYQGTGVTVEVARKLDVPNMVLIVNKTPASLDFTEVRERVAATYNCTVGAVLPHSDEMMTLASAGVFVLRFPDHPISRTLQHVAGLLLN